MIHSKVCSTVAAQFGVFQFAGNARSLEGRGDNLLPLLLVGRLDQPVLHDRLHELGMLSFRINERLDEEIAVLIHYIP